MTTLRVLDGVALDGTPVTGERSQALLAALAAAHGRAVGEGDLVEAVWGPADRPANAAKALQVVVSRTRRQTGAEVVVRVDGGYRLGDEVDDDATAQAGALREAVRAEARGDAVAARDAARDALVHPVATAAGVEALDALRDDARRVADLARAVLGRALAALGDHAEALPLLQAVPDPDETTTVALLRAEAAVHGVPAALAAYEHHRARLADDLGVDPGPALQALHAQLLAADNPVRTGVRFDATSLVGRDDDVRALRALVREARVVSILGPGGLGKTRLANLLAREAEQPVVHLVELVGVTSPDDVVGEVGSTLGVRDSVTGRRVLTAEQRADVRGRIAQQLAQAPTLLVLDNCEHVVEAVADLVAFLVATTSDLRVVTTTRAPLAIAAERVFALPQLSAEAATELFRQRAEAARPGVRLDDVVVDRVVARLDGLPLALELAAAKVRAMSVADIDRRLDDRFALLRGHDRGAPDRHQTLLAVIDWSWNLLDERDRRALRRLSLFADGFGLDGAEALCGPAALPALESLAGQSLVTVSDTADGGLRYRMLETVREFGRLRLAEAGDEDDARAARRAWGVTVAHEALDGLDGAGQVDAVRAVAREEVNLTDVLRETLAEPDPESVVVLIAALGGTWTIRGEHVRVIALLDALDQALTGWEPPDRLVDVTARATAVAVMNTTIVELDVPPRSRELFGLCAPRSSHPGSRAMARLVATMEGDGDLEAFVDDPDRHVASLALQWASHARENVGDADGAIEASTRALALWRPDDGVWLRSLHHTQLAGLYSQRGELARAVEHAAAGLAGLDALEAADDAVQLRAVLACAAIERGDLPAARDTIAALDAAPATGLFGGAVVIASVHAELALAEGDVERGLRLYRDALAPARSMRFPGSTADDDYQPYLLFAEGGVLAAHARHARAAGPEAVAFASRLHRVVVAKLPGLLSHEHHRPDYPLDGCTLFAAGAWWLLAEHDVERGVALLALAHRFGYSRYAPSMSWTRVLADAETIAPGALEAAVAAYGTRRGPDVLDDARAVVARL
ncbi:hypothetical protein GCM10023340_35670 [Nocardioides marinquilinus]|uniref:Transcriptional regulator n=1 Tax=Nocardioides marinquilinus TaxID=1210400 RepID=A0ABP9Q3N8_9ACTN